MTKRKKYTPEEIVRKLRRADELLAEGNDVAETCRQLDVATSNSQNMWTGLGRGTFPRVHS